MNYFLTFFDGLTQEVNKKMQNEEDQTFFELVPVNVRGYMMSEFDKAL